MMCAHTQSPIRFSALAVLPLRVSPSWARAGCKLKVLELQALVYDILPPTTAITDYAIGLEKLSTYGQFFAGAQMAVSL